MSNNDFRNNGGHKCVKTQDGEQMAQRIGAVAYVENSALTKEGVRNVSTKRKCYPTHLRVVQTQAILFLKSMSESVGSDIDRL